MNLGLVIGGAAQGFQDTWKMKQEEARANQTQAFMNSQNARLKAAQDEIASDPLTIGAPVGSNSQSWALGQQPGATPATPVTPAVSTVVPVTAIPLGN